MTLAALVGCKGPSINLSTNEPIKVDIAMRLDVYQHSAGGNATDSAPAASPTPSTPVAPGGASAVPREKDRLAEVQVFKNSRFVGEGRDGLLVVLEEPAGDYGSYVRRTVALENRDRMNRMKAAADTQKRSLPDIQKEQAALWVNRSFKGEWIEVKDSAGRFRWVQKEG